MPSQNELSVVTQTCAGAVVLTDIVFWGLIYPFTKGYRLSFVSFWLFLYCLIMFTESTMNIFNSFIFVCSSMFVCILSTQFFSSVTHVSILW